MVAFEGLGQLPFFNPDKDVEPANAAVQLWRDALRTADGIVISSPEYAHGVPGVLKNALDWVVGSGELVGKLVVLLNTSLLSHHAHDSLTEILTVMDARVLPVPALPLKRRSIMVSTLLEDSELTSDLNEALQALYGA